MIPADGVAQTAPRAAQSRHIEVSGLTFDYGDGAPVVDRLSFGIDKGEFVGLLGPSGCGKTTTLRLFAGLVTPTAGHIRIDGTDIVSKPPWERNLGLVFQSYALFPHMSVAQNIAFGLRLRRLPRAEIAERVDEALRIVRLENFGSRRPKQLSGGQQQRVAIARSIVIRPDILLLDEPLSNLDAKLRDEMRFEIIEIQRRTGITTLFVTHDQHEALTMCDRIAVMNEGRLEQIGTPSDIYDRSSSRFVADFIGRANTLSCTLDDGRPHCAGIAVPAPHSISSSTSSTLMIRPHVVQIVSAAEDTFTGKVSRRVFVGNIVEVDVVLPDGQTVLVEIRPGSPEDRMAGLDEMVGLTWPPEQARLFPQ